ncbi:CoB--CoM heterodisulfide reductase iron-sulfur subunit A family protein [bacterium]|nr:CoB--CoM heterodisulfide reductase iron-sulfur subunit A family protein [bacterium]
MSDKIGVYVCECGPNIGEAIDIDKVIEAISPIEDVAVVRRHKLLCSGDGQNFLVDEIKNEGLTHVVLGACSPKDHEITFMNVATRAGINPYLIQVVNIREQCAWIFKDKDIATKKAIKYIRAGIERIKYHKPLQKKELDANPDVLVLGGGLAGIEAALALTQTDRKVYLVEKSADLGGSVMKFEKLLSHQGFNLGLIKEKVDKINSNENIEVLTSTNVESVIGFFGNFEVTTKPAGEEAGGKSFIVGAVVVASGYNWFDLESTPRYGYKKIEDVFTINDFGRMIEESEKLKLSTGKEPKSIALVHCGGRKELGYCSRVCCMQMMNIGNYIKDKYPGIEVHELHSDLCVSSKNDQKYYEKSKEKGINFIRMKGVEVGGKAGAISIEYTTLAGDKGKLAVDMAVVAPGMIPEAGTPQVADMLNVPLHPTGFFKEGHEKLNPVGTTMDGIYVVGCAQGPKSFMETLIQAQAATGKIFSHLIPGKKIEPEVKVSEIIEAFCTGCQTCLDVCFYGAITYDEDKGVSVVNEAICRGCGNCAGSCPSDAIRPKHFTTTQLYQEVVEALRE